MKKSRTTTVRKKRAIPIPAALPSAAWMRWRKWLVPVGLAVLVGGLALLAVVLVGRATREALRQQERFTVAFTAIDCAPPPGLDRSEFLSEVQYLSGMPGQLAVLDEDLGQRLASALLLHPWVERVEQVRITPAGHVEARLVYRRPALAVLLDGQPRAVDRHGILLPPSASTDGLPIFPGSAKAPAGPAGTPWGDEAVEAAARAAAEGGR